MLKRLVVLMLYTVWISIPTHAQDCETAITLPDYQPASNQPFMHIADDQFMAGDEPYPVYGINYYPSQYPWRRFLREMNLDDVQIEMEMMQDIGINTLRIFLWNEALFQCDGGSIQPVESAFTRLDGFIALAHDYDFRLIVTLNDMPDLADLYDNPEHIQEQTRLIISRYLDEPAILAWDLRNEGDIDYGSRNILEVQVPRIQVLGWLRDTSELVRSIDNNHLLTAGWLNEAHSTAAYVDFLSFHHWTGADDLLPRIREIQLASSKPILLQEVGFSTHPNVVTEAVQAEALDAIFQMTDEQDLLGWMVWTAFDFPITATCYPSPCQSPDNLEHYFGIWHVDYSPKPALDVVRRYASQE